MLDTCICSFIMRTRPAAALQRFTQELSRNNRIVISAITYAEMRYGEIGKKASPKHKTMVDELILCLDEILPWERHAISAIEIKRHLAALGQPIGANDAAIAGHAIATGCTLITNNVREFSRVPKLVWEDWSTTTA